MAMVQATYMPISIARTNGRIGMIVSISGLHSIFLIPTLTIGSMFREFGVLMFQNIVELFENLHKINLDFREFGR